MLSISINPYDPDLPADFRDHLLKMQREHGDKAGEVLVEQIKLGIEKGKEDKKAKNKPSSSR